MSQLGLMGYTLGTYPLCVDNVQREQEGEGHQNSKFS